MRPLAVALCFALLACGPRLAPPPGRSAEVTAVADRLADQAAAEEPQITATVRAIAGAEGATLEGLSHRLKSRRSLRRKIALRAATHPDLSVIHPDIVDALRYTAVIRDRPRGRYVAATREMLADLESAGYVVVRVKNYWPRGDNYSGVNAVLRAPSGLQWELQFHTPQSVALRDLWHSSYERLRDPTTPAGERRRLFRRMSEPWNHVRVPSGALRPGALHRREQMRRYASP